MKIILAGFNSDIELLDDNKEYTPETFSAAYARISRSSKSVVDLRKQALNDVIKARKSNKNIIFGMGHHSVAEHANFNIDILDVSRLGMEELEHFRLASFTEKSQRYVKLNGDYLIPPEIKDKEDIKEFKSIIELQNNFYTKAYQKIKTYLVSLNKDDKNIEESAKEDARYALSLATMSQCGMTVNARTLEHMVSQLSLSKYQEVKEMAEQLYEKIKAVAPSIILFNKPSEFNKDFKNKDFWKDNKIIGKSQKSKVEDVNLLNFTQDADNKIISSILSSQSSISFNNIYSKVKTMSEKEKEKFFTDFFKNIEFFDKMPRVFETVDVEFEAVVSATNFAQLKRHRMATIIASPYDIDLGVTVPPTFKDSGLEDSFYNLIEKVDNYYQHLYKNYGYISNYILTNAHKRKVYVKMNLRELYHFIRLRADKHAQWDIRLLANKVSEKVKEIAPLASLMLCGKSDFINQYKEIYNSEPKFKI